MSGVWLSKYVGDCVLVKGNGGRRFGLIGNTKFGWF